MMWNVGSTQMVLEYLWCGFLEQLLLEGPVRSSGPPPYLQMRKWALGQT